MSEVLKSLESATVAHVRQLVLDGVRYEVLSLGGGVQSSALWLMNLAGLIEPRAEFAIFADTMWERKGTYAYLDYLDEQGRKAGFPEIMRVSYGDIREQTLDKKKAYVDIPFFTESGSRHGGQLNRQCSGKFKIKVVRRNIRKLFGMKKYAMQIGFSTDEITRRNDAIYPNYITLRYPLLEKRMSRQDCMEWLIENGHPVPIKSSCVGCPFRSDKEWKEMRQNHQDEFEDASDFDEKIRKLAPHSRRKAEELTLFEVEPPSYDIFVHNSKEALRVINFSDDDSSDEDVSCQNGCFL